MCKVHASRLQKMEHELWHQYQIIKEGTQQVVRCKNGPRTNPDKTVSHVVGRQLTTKQLASLNVSCYNHSKTGLRNFRKKLNGNF